MPKCAFCGQDVTIDQISIIGKQLCYACRDVYPAAFYDHSTFLPVTEPKSGIGWRNCHPYHCRTGRSHPGCEEHLSSLFQATG